MSRAKPLTQPDVQTLHAPAFATTVFTKTLWDNRRVLTVWALATGLLTMMYGAFYPQLSADSLPSMPEAMEGFGLADMSSAAGYLQGAVFGLLAPLLLVFYGAATGARMISANEESGYLDLLLAHPLSRTRLLLQRFAALTVGAVVIAAVTLLAMIAIRSGAELDSIGVGDFTAQAINLALLGVTFGALGTGIGAATGQGRAVVFGTTAGIGVLAYAVNGFAPQIHAEWLRYLSPFHYYIGGEPLKNGLQLTDACVLLAISVILVAAGAWRLNRRDIAR
ncbi:ABC transporter permease subunit [Actinopolymorpha pittospori]|uniref:ABC-2 type transport system permease protein n=1 Tax=Actinopolymorpha pittospori TaxID=648752 RepID=A0A927RE72_9ACTN|nr:ABC transporter permease subunit [Actinopolymorpha pittospori]MBE1613232.1 ABC-2 type transport system permease protein [Actinopolymorpha pittospori]